ncbi:SAM-dependent methyltransferase [Candidatus Uhrbacteria bacterium]|nr:SAM-dependent methyltransferase [Candidatus Uhrbacteria bacterium]
MITGLILYLLLVAVLIALGITVVRTAWFDAPFVPSGSRALKHIFDAVGIRPGEVFYDLGSGDGRVVREAARRGAYAIGIERSRILTWWARLLNVILRPPAEGSLAKARFINGNFLVSDISRADTVYCYLLPEAMAKLRPKFERELKPGARVVSRAFKIHGWTPRQRFQFGKRTVPVYLYIKD